MKFKVQSKELKSRLENLQKVRKTKTVIPILSYFKVEVTDDNVLMTASDKEITLIAKLIPEEVSSTGTLCVLADQFTDIVRKFKDETLTISEESNKLVVKSKGGKFRIPCVNPEDFPIISSGEIEGQVTIPSVIFLEGLNKTVFCSRKIEMEPIWSGINLKTSVDLIEFAATDKVRLGVYRSKYDIGTDANVLIPSALASMIQSTTTEGDIYINLSYDSKRIIVDLENYTIYCMMLEGNYPNYSVALNQSTDCCFVVNTQDLKSAVDRSLIFANTQSLIGISTLIGSVSVAAENNDWSLDSEEDVEAFNKEGSGQILVNGRYLVEVLNNINTEKVEFSFSANTPMVYVNPVDTEQDYLFSLFKYQKLS